MSEIELTPEQKKEAEEKKLEAVSEKINPILEENGVIISGVIAEVPGAPGFYMVQPTLKIKPETKNEKEDKTTE